MFPRSYDLRLKEWCRLRESCATMPYAKCLKTINSWWFQATWCPYHLHWDDRQKWPDPWQLLNDNLFCGLARALGIMYTITLIDRDDMQDAELIETSSDNLVLVGDKKYILNWDKAQIVNINPDPIHRNHRITQEQIKRTIA